jgi:hypothetical protein
MKRALLIGVLIVVSVFLINGTTLANGDFWWGLGAGILAAPLFFGFPYYAAPQHHYYYSYPAPPAYAYPAPSYQQSYQRVWIPGHWQWQDGMKVWVEGHWEIYPYY